MKLLTKIRTRVSTNIQNSARLLDYIFYKSSQKNDHVKSVFIDLKNPGLERCIYTLVKFFSLAGYRIDLKFNLWFLLNLRNTAELIYDIETLNLVFSKPKNYEVWLTDDEKVSFAADDSPLSIDTNYFKRDKEENSVTLPYNMHPQIYHKGLNDKINELRREIKNIRVFFGGNTGEIYENPNIEQLFGKINRNRITLKLLEAFGEENGITFIVSTDNLSHLFSEPDFEFVMLFKSFLRIEDWLQVLAKSKFFIAPPGVSMPFSHNIIEAMSVGSIPITQYAEFFDPPLENMRNCIVFENEQDMIEKIKYAIHLDGETIKKLNANVIDYYDTYLEPKTVVSNLINQLPRKKKIYVNAEHVSVTDINKSTKETQRKRSLKFLSFH